MKIKNGIERELGKIKRKEDRFLREEPKKENEKLESVKGKIKEKIPPKLVDTLNKAFTKAFYLVFEKGTAVVEKTFRKEDLSLEFSVNDFRVQKSPTEQSVRKVDRLAKKSGLVNACITTAEGVGLGLLGVGLPDIPLFIGVLMKGLYETATSYGYSYETEAERVFLLRLIRGALASPENRSEADGEVEEWIRKNGKASMSYVFSDEIEKTAASLSMTMLTAKFIQGLPVVGAAGGLMNPVIYRKVQKYAARKYKKRYLLECQEKRA